MCVLSEGQDQWGAAFSAFILAQQAGFSLEFQHGDQPTKRPAESFASPFQSRWRKGSSPRRGPQPASILSFQRVGASPEGAAQVPWWQWVAITRPLRNTSIRSIASCPRTRTFRNRFRAMGRRLPMGSPFAVNSSSIRSPVTP